MRKRLRFLSRESSNRLVDIKGMANGDIELGVVLASRSSTKRSVRGMILRAREEISRVRSGVLEWISVLKTTRGVLRGALGLESWSFEFGRGSWTGCRI